MPRVRESKRVPFAKSLDREVKGTERDVVRKRRGRE